MDDHTAVGAVQCLYSSQAPRPLYSRIYRGIPVYTGESRVYTLYTAVQRYIPVYSRYSQIGYIAV